MREADFDSVPLGNAVNTASGHQMMSFSYVEKDPNRDEDLNLNLEQSTSLTAAAPKI